MTSIPTAAHLADFQNVWTRHVTINGRLIEDFVARELYDFRHCMIEIRAVYQAVAGIDRPDADADTVLAHATYDAATVRVNYLRSRALVVPDDQPAAEGLREQLWRIAAQWETQHPKPAEVQWPEQPAWMTAALTGESHRDHEVEFDQIWREHLVDDAGQLDQDKVAQVLSAYLRLLRTVPGVYDDLAGLSKPNCAAHHVIDGAEERWREMYADYLCDEAYPLDEGPVKTALIELANEWNPTAWDEHLAGRRITDHLAALAAGQKKEMAA